MKEEIKRAPFQTPSGSITAAKRPNLDAALAKAKAGVRDERVTKNKEGRN
jgi:hypothetical protein